MGVDVVGRAGAAGRDLPAGAAAGGPLVSRRESPCEPSWGQKPPPSRSEQPAKEGHASGGADEGPGVLGWGLQLGACCNEALPEYMIPDEIIFREDLPRTDRGKVDYRALEREAAKQQGGNLCHSGRLVHHDNGLSA